MSNTLYQIKGWDDHFEGSKSRTYNNKTSCTMPTKHGLGYRRLISENDGPAMFGAWCAVVQLLSRQNKPRCGYLTDNGKHDGKPYTASDLELLTGIKQSIFERMLKVCSTEVVDWMCVIEPKEPQLPIKEPQSPIKEPRSPDGLPQGSLDSNSNSDTDSDTDTDSRACGKAAKLSFGEFSNVMLTEQEYNKLCDKHGKQRADAGIETLGAWMKSTGKRRKDHYASLNASSWVWDKVATKMPEEKQEFVSRFK